jgi:uncharacterized coiled-coil protein SlyX
MEDKQEETPEETTSSDPTPGKPRRSRSTARSKQAAADTGPLAPADDQGGVDGGKTAHPAATHAGAAVGAALPASPQIPPPPGGPPPTPDYAARIAADVAPPTFGQRLGRAVRRVFGWLIAAIFGLAIGLLVFVLAPGVLRNVLAPISANRADIDRLDSEVNQLDNQLSGVETDQAASVVAQEAALRDAQAAAEKRVVAAEARVAEAEGRLAGTEARLSDAEDEIAAQKALIADLQKTLDAYAEQVGLLETQLATLQEELPGVEEYAAYNRLLLLMRAWQELLNARMRLLENNPGLALDVLGEARALLQEAYVSSTPEEQALLDPILARLDQVAVSITENPFAATGDLEIAWHDLGLLIAPPDTTPPAGAQVEAPAGGETADQEPTEESGEEIGEPPVPPEGEATPTPGP